MSCPRGCCATYREHIRSIAINPTVSLKMQAERNLSKDLDAYKRLVQSGAQPKKIDGAHELERLASTKHEVEHSNVIADPNTRVQVTRAFDAAKDVAVTPIAQP